MTAAAALRHRVSFRRAFKRWADDLATWMSRGRDRRIRRRLRHLVHVGGHHGEEIRAHLDRLEGLTIHLFEANPDLAARLEGEFSGRSDVVVHGAAMADRDGEGPFFVSRQTEGSSLYGTKRNLVDAREISVPYVAAGGFVDGLDGEVALYLNCEGGEFRILPDLLEQDRWRKVPLAHVSWHDQAWRLPEMAPEAARLRRGLAGRGVRLVTSRAFYKILAL